MTDDRALLEAAAKACGYEIDRWANDENGVEYVWLTNADPWQPLHRNTVTDCMGDALGLAVKLRAMVDLDSCSLGVEVLCRGADFYESFADHLNDEMAATRRAIVRAAAAIGNKP